MFKIKSYLRKYIKFIVVGPFFKFLEAVTDILNPFLVSLMIDVGVAEGNVQYIFTLTAIVIMNNILGIIFALICNKCSALTSEGVGRDIRSSMFKHINTFSHKEFDRFTTMSLTNRCVHDVDQIQTAIGLTIRQVSRVPFLIIGATVMSMIIDLQLSIIFLILMPILFIAIYSIMRITNPIYVESKTRLDNVSNVTRENLSGIRVVRAFNKQEHEKHRFSKANTALSKCNIKVGIISSILHPLLFLVINLATVAIIWFGGIRVEVGGLSQGNVIAFINYVSQISIALVVVARIIITYTKTGASTKRINEVFKLENSIKEEKTCEHLPPTTPASIEFKNVNFSYTGTKDVIRNLSFKLEPGQTLGIIGGTGSGKSSIVNLIPRFYDTTSGEVLINGVNVKNYNIKELREYVGFVPQNATLFKGTLRENLSWRKEDASDFEIIKALKISQSIDFVRELPDFLEHKVERGGTNFSGGQKQRLTIARALVGKPKILIMDASSSALDFATDASLRKAIYQNLKGITTIIVSQRTNSIKNCDLIITMDNGEVAGIGTHEELMKNCPIYAEIYYSQNKEKGE